MNLVYRVLWVEDERDFVESLDMESFRRYVEEEGFDLDLEFRMTPDEIRAPIDGRQFDLLVIDYNIDDELRGSDVIQQVRGQDCLTEVIFYSNSGLPTLRAVAADQQLEGVFFSGRDEQLLLGKLRDVFKLTVRKVVDVDNMRGIVMAGVADIDHLVADVIRAVHDSLDEGKRVELCRKLLAKMRPVVNHLKLLVKQKDHTSFDEFEKLIDAVTALDPADFETLLAARGFDSTRRVNVVVGLCKEHEQLKPHKAGVDGIKNLLQWRNALAHQKPRVDATAGALLFEPTPGKPEAFDDVRRLQLRKDLRTQRLMLEQMLKALR